MNMFLSKLWYRHSVWHPLILLLIPFSWLFALLVRIRLWLYKQRYLSSYVFKQGVVIVVGNVTVGGTGKTPFVIWLANFLQGKGLRPAIISRGYGALMQKKHPYQVKDHDAAHTVSDEALLLCRRTTCPVFICDSKVRAAQYIATHTDCNVIICDDGLQHYQLARDMEVALVDECRGFGNYHLLPAGPLREPVQRLQQVDFLLTTITFTKNYFVNKNSSQPFFQVMLRPTTFIQVNDKDCLQALETFKNQTVHAVAGIGNPERFFETLRALNIAIIPHSFIDHYRYTAKDFVFAEDSHFPIMMTEKDAVKCSAFAKNNWWYVAVELQIEDVLSEMIFSKIKDCFNVKEMRYAKKLASNYVNLINN